jgi:hypothetical protein
MTKDSASPPLGPNFLQLPQYRALLERDNEWEILMAIANTDWREPSEASSNDMNLIRTPSPTRSDSSTSSVEFIMEMTPPSESTPRRRRAATQVAIREDFTWLSGTWHGPRLLDALSVDYDRTRVRKVVSGRLGLHHSPRSRCKLRQAKFQPLIPVSPAYRLPHSGRSDVNLKIQGLPVRVVN